MPIYEYKCPACTEVFEELRKIADRNNPAYCQTCGSAAHPIFSSFGVLDESSTKRQDASPSQIPSSDGIQIRNCTFENLNVGISAPKGANIEMKGNRFKNVKKPVEFREK